ncbi:unnamed protein product [Albugo candida]|uniref:SEC7 domain-containing protein n=1 Tax=Albugo candida TaxID=65357 RepID=A0A024GKN5_9STRA|nr:unnamed protein product [Albugo candida]|eukprot:CCI47299.1 unnamed protein product [Albugo candida]
MEAQVLKSLHKVRKICPRSHREVRDCLDAAIAGFEKRKKEANPSTSNGLEVPFEPFLLAVLTRHGKLVAVALDAIEKFLAFGYLKTNAIVPDSIRKRVTQKTSSSSITSKTRSFQTSNGSNGFSPGGHTSTSSEPLGTEYNSLYDPNSGHTPINQENWKLMDYIIQIICNCNDHADEAVQLQVLRVLLTAVTTITCEVHEQSLLKVIRACYHIHLISKNGTNQTIAKATLQQIISIIFQRMENFDQRVQQETKLQFQSTPAQFIENCFPVSPETRPSSPLPPEIPSQWIGNSMYPSVAALFHFEFPSTPSFVVRPSQSSFSSVLHKDAFLLFRSLCRISMRSIAEDASFSTNVPSNPSTPTPLTASNVTHNCNDDPFAFQSKILSLELVLFIINHAGPSFRQGDRFIHAIRQYLCQSLLQNCTSNNTNIVGLSLQLFLILIQHFKRFLRAEIEIFITSVFLRLLQSENSSFDHKMLVLQVLHTVCEDAAFLGEIFLNYDCDWVSSDLFRSIVDVLARVAKGKSQREFQSSYGHLSSSARQKMIQNDSAITIKGLECLTAIAGSLKKAAHCIDTQVNCPIVNIEKETVFEPEDVLPSVSAINAIEAFDRKKKRQEEIATGILKFNVKPAAGIQFLVERGHLESDPKSVALFLLNYNSKLDKTEIGEFLGREPAYQNGYCIKILHEFVDLLDFSNLEIDLAIRHFLSKFRLPGESQKIDRIMEKFAERYFQHCGANVFPSADTAFILSFSIIMLQTDLHNPSVVEEKKMDKASFIRNNRGINNGQDLPEEYLGGIYDRIKALPISLKEDDEFRAKNDLNSVSKRPISGGNSFFGASSALNDRMRRDAYSRERETMVRQSELLFKRRNPAIHSPHESNGKANLSKMYQELDQLAGPCHVRPMFETLWAPLLACCSVVFESTDASVAIDLCLNAFKDAIHLSSRLEMAAERDAFVTVLSKFTALHTIGSRAIRLKNIDAIKALISISVKEGNFLMDAWRDILQCISQLAKIQLHGIGAEAEFFGSPVSKKSITSPHPIAVATATDDRIAVENENAARILEEIDSLATDRVFSSSMHLNDTAVQEFIQQLCVVSLSECSGISNNRVAIPPRNTDSNINSQFSSFPRVYCLQKLVEVADMNMHTRSRVVWASMWKVLSRHFTTIGCHENLSVAMYAIDSLKQLSMKFLEREELKDFNFQRLFLTPFEVVMANASNLEIRELVLRCVENMILARVGNIKSGWKTIWAVLRVAAETYDPFGGEKERDIIRLGFRIAKQSLTDHLCRMMDVFVDAVECVLAFAVCQDEGQELLEKSVECVELLECVCFEELALGNVNVTEKESHGKRIAFRKKTFGKELKGEKRYEKKESLGLLETEIDAASRRLLRSSVGRAAGIDAATSGSEGLDASVGIDAATCRLEGLEASAGMDAATSKVEDTATFRLEAPVEIDAGTRGWDGFSDPGRGTEMELKTCGSLRFKPEVQYGADESGVYTDSAAHLRLWWPVLTALATLAADRRLDVRWMALHALFDALKKHGLQFSRRLWSMIFRGVLIPLLHDIQLAELDDHEEPRLKVQATLERCSNASQTTAQTRADHCLSPTNAETQWRDNTLVSATSTMCLERLLDLFGAFYDRIGFLPEVIFVLGNCMEENEELAVAAATALEQMLVVHGPNFPENVWGLIADELCAVMMRITPAWTAAPATKAVISMYPNVISQLELQFSSNDNMLEDRHQVSSKTHLIVLLALQKIFGRVVSAFVKGKVRLVDAHASNLLRCLKQSYVSCEFLNRNIEMRRQLSAKGWKYGVDGRDDVVPNVFLQEVEGKLAYGKVLFDRILKNKKRDEARNELSVLLRESMQEYLVWSGVWPAEEMEERMGGKKAMQVDASVCVMRYQRFWVCMLSRLAQLQKHELEVYLFWLYPLLNDLIKVDDVEVRKALVAIYQQGIVQFLPIEYNQKSIQYVICSHQSTMGKHYISHLALLLIQALFSANATPSIDLDKMNFGSACEVKHCTSKETPVPIKDYVFTSNGCGMAGAPMKGYEFLSDCCDLHDACYSVCGITKAYCDSSLKKCMTENCDGVTDKKKKEKCDRALSIYNLGAKLVGCPAFTAAQKEACYCVPKANDAAAYKERLLHFLQKHADSEEKKTEEAVDKLLKKHKGKEAKLFYRLVKKYTGSILLDNGKKNFMSKLMQDMPNLMKANDDSETDEDSDEDEVDQVEENAETDEDGADQVEHAEL